MSSPPDDDYFYHKPMHYYKVYAVRLFVGASKPSSIFEVGICDLSEEEQEERREESEEDEDAVVDEDLLIDHPLDLIDVVLEGKVYLRGPSSFPERKSHGLLDVTSDATVLASVATTRRAT